MATVTQERRPFWNETDRRVRHPLQTVRYYIRQYVILEGLGQTLLYLSVAFWLGLAFDWGLVRVTGIDWIQSLQNMTGDSSIDMYVRGLLLTVVVLGLLAIAVTRTVMRLFREFSDPAMALLLERRFPRELGDRLITAVELADPRQSEKNGYSLPLIEKTIRDAAERVERVPVRGVFNWARLRWIYIFLGLATVGMYCVSGAVACLFFDRGVDTPARTAEDGTKIAETRKPMLPLDFVSLFNETAGIWLDRNVLLRDVHWPRQAFLEVVGFVPTKGTRNEMRVGAGEERPPLRVRAIKWLKSSPGRRAQGGWEPLMVADLSDLFDQDERDTLLNITLPADWAGWVLDTDDERSDWHDWTVDQLWRQFRNDKVRLAMDVDARDCNSTLNKMFERLSQLADKPGMGRRIRELATPEKVSVYSSANGKVDTKEIFIEEATKNCPIGFSSVTHNTIFRVTGLDFTTPTKTIAVIPPPSLVSLTVDRYEPAYAYFRLVGADQRPLKGVKHVSAGELLAITDVSRVKVIMGSDVVLHGEIADVNKGKLKGVSLRALLKRDLADDEEMPKGAVPEAKVEFPEENKFTLKIANVVTTMDFVIVYKNENGALGERRVRIDVVADTPPEAFVEIESEKQVRLPKMRGKTTKVLPPAVASSYIITPDAVLPLRGRLRDDYGITDANWVVRLEPTDVEFVEVIAPKDSKDPKDAGKDAKDMKDPAKDGKDAKDAKGPAKDAKDAKDAKAPVKDAKDMKDIAKDPNVVKKLPPIKLVTKLKVPLRNIYGFDSKGNILDGTYKQFEAAQDARSITLVQIEALNELAKEEGAALMLMNQGKYLEAGPIIEKVLGARQANLDKDHPDVGKSLRLMSDWLDATKKDEDAKNFRAQAIAIDRVRREALVRWEKTDQDDFKVSDLHGLVKNLKALDGPQLHYMLTLSLDVTDNNVEKGPITVEGASKVRFIIVSDTEFLAQIGEDEDPLSNRLDKAYESLEKSRSRLREQMSILGSPLATYDDVRTRVGLAQIDLAHSFAVTKEVFKEYEAIENHLFFNRALAPGRFGKPFGQVHEKHVRVKKSIVTPLMDLVEGEHKDRRDPRFPPVDFPSTEFAVNRLLESAGALKGFIPSELLGQRELEAKDCEERVNRLMAKLDRVVNEIKQVVSENQIRSMLRSMSTEQDRRGKALRKLYQEEYQRILDSLNESLK